MIDRFLTELTFRNEILLASNACSFGCFLLIHTLLLYLRILLLCDQSLRAVDLCRALLLDFCRALSPDFCRALSPDFYRALSPDFSLLAPVDYSPPVL